MFDEYYKKLKSITAFFDNSGNDLGLGIDTRRDWKVLCILFLFIVSIVLITNILFFYSGGYFVGNVSIETLESIPSLDKMRLLQVTDNWRAREVDFNKLFEKKDVLIDPSS